MIVRFYHCYLSAESKPEECKDQFIGAVVWARRLGNAAKLGAQVLMRQPDNSNLFKPTPVINRIFGNILNSN